MKIKKKIIASLGILLCSSILLQGCGSSDEQKDQSQNETKQTQSADQNEDSKENKETVSLSDWEGTWNNLGGYLEEKDVQPGFEELAKKENMDVAKVKEEYLKKRKADFNGLIIKGNKVTFLDNFKDKEGKEIATYEYEYVDKHKTKHGDEELEWDVFKAKDKDAKYPVLLMMPVHGEEELVHFHMRYGNDEKELLSKDNWFPTFVKPDSTTEQIIGEIAE